MPDVRETVTPIVAIDPLPKNGALGTLHPANGSGRVRAVQVVIAAVHHQNPSHNPLRGEWAQRPNCSTAGTTVSLLIHPKEEP